ncbi:HIRAN domain-containing protein [Parabacteroides pacaensis]|uniref:HIRAN domain-containing protein n=1 Tax=Parabacteroides pacaensis TaxID=2086575 RepID=UPI000D0E9036|nr:HIRAN domain-containing protein [Parabacteroides pacaensis]
MVYLIVVLFIIAIVAGVVSANNTKSPSIQDFSDSTTVDYYFVGDKCIGLSARKGYSKYRIAGVYYRNLPLSMVGRFNGYAEVELHNKYDSFAIAIYNDAGIHLGYIPKEYNRKLHSYIMENGGKVHAYGYIACDSRNSMYGETCVETDKTLVTKRNKPYITS